MVQPRAQSSTGTGPTATAVSAAPPPGIAPPGKWVRKKFDISPLDDVRFRQLMRQRGARRNADFCRAVFNAGLRAMENEGA